MRLVFLLLAVLPPALGVSIAHAQEPKPTSLPGPNAAAVVIYVINDLNANGRQDPGEPGLEGWQVYQACSDALLTIGHTDATGKLVTALSPSEPCILLDVPNNWLWTNGNQRILDLHAGATAGTVFLVHYAGDVVQNFGGNLFVDGLPALGGTRIDAVVGGSSCGSGAVEVSSNITHYSLYVLSESDRAGCARTSDPVAFTVNGTVVASRPFEAPRPEYLDLVLGPTPMYFYLEAPEGTTPVPFVGSTACGESRRSPAFPFASYDSQVVYFTVYVFSDALRTGCGAPGRTVTVKAGGLIIQQVPWSEGQVLSYELPPFTPIPDVTLPITGRTARDADDFSLAFFAAAAGIIFVAGGLLARRKRSRPL
jgi:hypothetical protein